MGQEEKKREKDTKIERQKDRDRVKQDDNTTYELKKEKMNRNCKKDL